MDATENPIEKEEKEQRKRPKEGFFRSIA